MPERPYEGIGEAMSRRFHSLILVLFAATAPAQEPDTRATLIRAGKVLTMAGKEPVMLDGEVLVRAGKIVAVGRAIPVGKDTIIRDFPDQILVPGFVELHCHVGVSSGDTNDTVLPHNMDLRTIDTVMKNSDELLDAARAGVTTVLIIPGSGSTIGGLGTIVKTGHGLLKDRLVRYPGALKIALHARGGNPARAAGDLGSGRLGLHYMLKVVMAEARDYHHAWTKHEGGGGPRPKFNPRLDPLRGLFRREFPVILHAYGQNDTMTAIRILKWGLELPIVISHGVYDSFKIKAELSKQGVPMNLGPRQYEFYHGAFVGNAAELQEAGVPVSICTDAPVVAADQLPLQAAMAVRMGLDDWAALRGLTIEPSKAVFIDDRVGSIEPGKDADLVVFPGDPLDPRNPPSMVMIDGKMIVERQ